MRLELIAELHPGTDREALKERLVKAGVDAMPMKAGLLLAGEVSVLRAVIPGMSGDEQGPLEVPENLKDVVKAIHVVKPRSLY